MQILPEMNRCASRCKYEIPHAPVKEIEISQARRRLEAVFFGKPQPPAGAVQACQGRGYARGDAWLLLFGMPARHITLTRFA